MQIRPLKSLCLSVSCSLWLWACTTPAPNNGSTPQPSASASDPAAAPTGMSAEELQTLAKTYTQSLKALNAELKPSSIHGARVKTFLDATGLETYQAGSFPYPEGTLSLKESHASENGPIQRLYVMKKIINYDPEHNDWYYAVMSLDGVPSQQGKVQMCISCHQSAAPKDYIYGFSE